MEKLWLPETGELISRMNRHLSRQDRWAFFATVILGLLTHLYMFTNKLMGRDDLLCLFVNNDMVTHGRWLLKYPSALSSTFSLPLVGGVLSILAIAFTCVLICRLLEIKQSWQVVLVSGALVTFPSVANTFSYMFVADAFFIACLAATLSAYLTDRIKLGWLWGMILLAASMAVYQGYVCFLIPLLAMRYFQHLILDPSDDRAHLKRLFCYAAAVVGGIAAYMLLTKLVLALRGASLGAGQGLDSMGLASFKEIPSRILTAYREFFEFWFRTSMIETFRAMRYINLALGGVIAYMLIYVILAGRLSPVRKVLAGLIIALIPVLFNAVYLMGANNVHWVMIYAFALIYVLGIVGYNLMQNQAGIKPLKRCRWIPNATGLLVSGILLITSFSWAVNANKVYFAMDLYYENCFALVNRVVYDAEHQEGYEPGMPMAVIGSFNDGNYLPTKAGSFKSLSRQSALQSENDYVLISDDTHFRAFARYFVGFYTAAPEAETLNEALSSDIYQAMPCYPEKGSCRVINGIMIVKAAQNAD